MRDMQKRGPVHGLAIDDPAADHGDFVDPISDEDTQLVIELMAEILNEVFQSPAKIKRAQAAALARKQ